MAGENIGKLVQIIGPVVDIRFNRDNLPELLNAIEINSPSGRVIVEVAQHIGDDIVRCVSMGPTDGLIRGMEAKDTGKPITVPVGRATLGRILNVVGEPIDEKGPIESEFYASIHKDPQLNQTITNFRNRHQINRSYSTIFKAEK